MTIPDGAFVVLLGPTGAGKTTTLRLIAGLDRPDAGDIRIDGTSVLPDTPAQRDVAMPEDQIAKRVAEVAQALRIPHKLDNKATALSGGEMQRVSIGRALVRNPRIYLMDEPLSSLDAKLRADLRVELKRIHAELGATFLYVTHDQIEAMTMATHVGVLDHGRLVQFGTPREIYESPVSTYVATRLGQPRITLLPADAFGPAPRNAAQIGLRPEHILQGDGQPAIVRRLEHLGDQTRLHLSFGPHEIVTLADPHTGLAAGDTVLIRPHTPLWFDATGARIQE
jgi:multiple sugar transport system ATP-binding protein